MISFEQYCQEVYEKLDEIKAHIAALPLMLDSDKEELLAKCENIRAAFDECKAP